MPTATPRPGGPPTSVVGGVCPHDCPDSCAWEVTVEDRPGAGPVAVGLRGRADHPFTRGELCPKVNSYLERVYHPDRLRHPLIRTGPKGSGHYREASWDEALGRVAGHLQGIIERDGPGRILPYGYAGNQGLVQCSAMSERFFNRIGAARVVGGLCGNTSNAGIAATQGSGVDIDPEDLGHADVVLLWGTNTLVTNRHLWPVLEAARARGATLVCIDPLRTTTAARADWHVALLPGTDGALALAMMHVLVAEDLVDHDYLAAHTVGFEALRDRVREWTPTRAAAVCGVTAADIERLALLYGRATVAAIRVLIGMEHHEHGAMAYRTITCLPALVGAWRHRGGGLVRSTGPLFAELLPGAALERPDLGPGHRRPVPMGRLGAALTAVDPAERVDALVVFNCNPAVITPNQRPVLAGLRRDDLFTVVLEHFMTDTAALADVILPATTQPEHLDLMAPWGHRWLTLNRPAIPPVGEALPNSEIFRRLARVWGLDDPALAETDEALIRGVLAAATHPFMAGVTYERLVAEGSVRVGPADWRPWASGPFPTPSGRIELVAPHLAALGLDPVPGWEPDAEGPHGDPERRARFPLVCLTSKRQHRFLNSSYAQQASHTAPEGRPLLELHAADAEARGIATGDTVEVGNDRGTLVLHAQVSDRVRPGVVTVPFGWPLAAGRGVGCNVFTNDGPTDLGGGTAFHDNLVEVRRVGSPV